MFQFLEFLDSATIFLVKAVGVVSLAVDWPFAVFPDDVIMMMMMMMMMMITFTVSLWRMTVGVPRLQTPLKISHLYLPHAHLLILNAHARNLICQNPQIHKSVHFLWNELDNELDRCFIVTENVFAQWEQLFLHSQIPTYPDSFTSQWIRLRPNQ